MRYRYSQIKKLKTIEILDTDTLVKSISIVKENDPDVTDNILYLVPYTKIVIKSKFSSNSNIIHYMILEADKKDEVTLYHYTWDGINPLKEILIVNFISVDDKLKYSIMMSKLSENAVGAFINVVVSILMYYSYISNNNIKDSNIKEYNMDNKEYIEVKGHLRHYKNGTVRWINPYKIKRKNISKS